MEWRRSSRSRPLVHSPDASQCPLAPRRATARTCAAYPNRACAGGAQVLACEAFGDPISAFAAVGEHLIATGARPPQPPRSGGPAPSPRTSHNPPPSRTRSRPRRPQSPPPSAHGVLGLCERPPRRGPPPSTPPRAPVLRETQRALPAPTAAITIVMIISSYHDIIAPR
jgi:hypothetical protein